MSPNDARPTPEQDSARSTAPPRSPTEWSESELARRYWDRVRVFAARRLRDAAAAEDVAQEAIQRVVAALRADRVRDLQALPSFVFQTAHHVCLQHLRGAGREVRALERLHASAETASGPTDVLTLLITEERRAAVRAALAELSAEDRDLLDRLYREQIEPEAVARALGVTPGALRVRKHRALKRLGDLLAGTASNAT